MIGMLDSHSSSAKEGERERETFAEGVNGTIHQFNWIP